MLKAWLEWLLPFGPEDDYPICVHVRSKETNLPCTIFVGPMNEEARKQIVTKMRDGGPALGFKRSKASQVEGKSNRIS